MNSLDYPDQPSIDDSTSEEVNTPDGGCGSVVNGASVGAILIGLAAAFGMKNKRKKEDGAEITVSTRNLEE